METMISNAQNCVASSANNNNNNFSKIITNIGLICPKLLKSFLTKYGRFDLGDGMKLVYVPTDDTILRVYLPDGNWRNVVKNHSVGSRCNWKYIAEQVRQILCGHYNVPNPKNFPTFNDWANDLIEYGFCGSDKRMEKIWAENRENNKEWENLLEQQTEKMMEIVADAQESIDHLTMDLASMGKIYADEEDAEKLWKARQIVENINDICAQCLIDCGEVCGCMMVKDDGFFPDLTEFERWSDGMDFADTIALLDECLTKYHYTYCA